jgi:hypothetical protein
MSARPIALALSLILSILMNPAAGEAATQVFSRAGAWEAFGGTSNNGRPVCGISSRGTGKYFGLKYFGGDVSFTIQLGSSSWRVQTGSRQPVVLRFDRASPWNGLATGIHFGDGEAGLEFSIRRGQLDQFMREFRGASELIIEFPRSNANGWRAALRGTDVISDSLVRCIRALR